ncbi:MAG: AAA family ATPase [Proteobacteria bacterium]|nr:AAA family ATPase [Candidatus Enterousia onthequi]
MTELVQILSDAQKVAFDTIERTHQNVLIMGQAGTGKSTFINYLKSASKKRIVCACPTAVSALNIGGQTIHSLFQIQPRDFIMPEFLKLKAKTRNILQATDVLIIDEVSMVAPDLLDAMDLLARQARRDNAPFGGIQIVAIGDLFQLPPVITSGAVDYFKQEYGFENSYFFDSHVYSRSGFVRFSFDKVYRQNDGALLDNLVRLRDGDLTSLEFFNQCKIVDDARRANAVLITPYRQQAENINAARLRAINAPEISFVGVLEGNFSEKDVPAPIKLNLKVGALVVFVKNSDKWHNGSMGRIVDMGGNGLKVELLNAARTIVNVKPEKWEKIEYVRDENDRLQEHEIGSYKQFPLNLGYAMTIHKAQGKTLDAVVVDISRGAFAHGQTYVALSRTRSAADMHVATALRPKDVIFDKRVLEFME